MYNIFAVLSALGATIAHGWANILDSYISNNIFKRLSTVIFFGATFNLLFLPFIFILGNPKIIPFSVVPIILLIAGTQVLYQYPYFWALRKADTSVVTSLFSIGDLLIPLLAFLVVGERLTIPQYIGFFMTIIASIAISINPKKFKMNGAAILMLGVSILLALQSVLYKYLFESGLSWETVTVWGIGGEFLVAGIVVIFSRNKTASHNTFSILKKSAWMLILIQILSWGGEALGNYALVMLPTSVVQGITATQPIFVLIFAVLFAKRFPEVFKEETERGTLFKKIMLFVVMIIGSVMTIL